PDVRKGAHASDAGAARHARQAAELRGNGELSRGAPEPRHAGPAVRCRPGEWVQRRDEAGRRNDPITRQTDATSRTGTRCVSRTAVPGVLHPQGPPLPSRPLNPITIAARGT